MLKEERRVGVAIVTAKEWANSVISRSKKNSSRVARTVMSRLCT